MKATTNRSLDPNRPRAWTPGGPWIWNPLHDVSFNGDRRKRFDEIVRSSYWHVQEPFVIDNEPLLDGLPRLASGERVWATRYGAYYIDGEHNVFAGIAVGTDRPRTLRFYLPTETGELLLTEKPVETELLSKVEKAMLVQPADLSRKRRFRGEQIEWPEFCATHYISPDQKRALAQQIVDFVDADFPLRSFRGDLLKQMSRIYELRNGHYTDTGFYQSNFATPKQRVAFLRNVIRLDRGTGTGNEGHTLCDVEHWVAEVLIDRGYLPAYEELARQEELAAECAEFERLQEKFKDQSPSSDPTAMATSPRRRSITSTAPSPAQPTLEI